MGLLQSLCSLAMMGEFRIYCDEIPQSSWGMTKKVKLGDDKEHARRDFYRYCPVKPDNDTRLMRSPGQVGGRHKDLAMSSSGLTRGSL